MWISAVQPSTEESAESEQRSSRRRRNEPEIRTAESSLIGRSLRKPFVMVRLKVSAYLRISDLDRTSYFFRHRNI